MSRIIVESINDMPDGARGGMLPLGCVLDTDGNRIVAFGEGSTFSGKGLKRIAPSIQSFSAMFHVESMGDPIKVRAVDIKAALQWLRRHYVATFDLYVDAQPVFLGEFEERICPTCDAGDPTSVIAYADCECNEGGQA